MESPSHMVGLALGTQQRTLTSGTKDGSSTKISLTASEETLAPQYIVLKQVWAERQIKVLKNFIFVNSHGQKKLLEMYKEQNLYIADIDPINGKVKLILSWVIFGLGGLYPPSIWLSTYEVDYTCIDPTPSYKECFDVTFRKVLICGLVFKILLAADIQNPKLSFDELLSAVVVSLRENEYFSGSAPSKDYIISLGSFIHN